MRVGFIGLGSQGGAGFPREEAGGGMVLVDGAAVAVAYHNGLVDALEGGLQPLGKSPLSVGHSFQAGLDRRIRLGPPDCGPNRRPVPHQRSHLISPRG